MINLFRKNQRVLMLVVAVLTIIAFLLLYNTSQLDRLARTQNVKIYGETLTPEAISRQVRNYQLTIALGQFDLITKLGGSRANRGEAISDFVWNLLVLQHQARVLGIEPTAQQVENRIKSLPVFQTASQFDPIKYEAFFREQLAPRGFTERQLEEVMRDALRLERISALVEAPIAVGDNEIRAAARAFQPVTVSFVRFDNTNQSANIQVSQEEVSEYYEQHKAELNTPELRAVRYVVYELPLDRKLEGKEKINEMQKLANSASDFAESLNKSNSTLQKAAEAAGVPIRSIPPFDRSGSLQDASTVPEAVKQMGPLINALVPTAFQMQKVGETSDVIQVGDAFYVLELSELSQARPLTLAEATPQIEARLREIKTEKLLRESAEKQIADLHNSLSTGKSFTDAATQLGLKVESLNHVSLQSESLTPDQRRIVSSTFSLREGELSKFQPAPWGGFCVHLKTRAPLEDKDLEAHQEQIRQSLVENKRNLLFAEWLRTSRQEANITIPGKPTN